MAFMVDVSTLSTLDLLRCAAITVGFLAVLIGERVTGKSLWLKATCIADLGLGVFLLAAPEVFLGHGPSVKTDVFGVWLLRAVGTLYVANSLAYGYTANKQDVFSQRVLANIIRGAALVQILFYFNGAHHSSFTRQLTSFLGQMLIMQLIGNLYHLFRSTDFSKSKTPAAGSCITRHLIVSIVTIGFFAIANLALPNYYSFMFTADYKPTVVADFAQRMIGALMLGEVVYLILALRFADDRDKVAIYKGNLANIAMAIPLDAYYLHSTPVNFGPMFIIPTMLWVVEIVNTLAVLFYTGKPKKD